MTRSVSLPPCDDGAGLSIGMVVIAHDDVDVWVVISSPKITMWMACCKNVIWLVLNNCIMERTLIKVALL